MPDTAGRYRAERSFSGVSGPHQDWETLPCSYLQHMRGGQRYALTSPQEEYEGVR